MILGFGHEPSEVTKKIAGAESLTHGADWISLPGRSSDTGAESLTHGAAAWPIGPIGVMPWGKRTVTATGRTVIVELEAACCTPPAKFNLLWTAKWGCVLHRVTARGILIVTGCVAGISGGWFLTAYLQPPIWLRCHLSVQFHRQTHSV
jgi:hypothetical protein